MKKFMALYIGSASQAEKAATVISDDTRARGMAAWGSWMAKHEANIVDPGGPLGVTKRASAKGISDTRNDITGFVIVEAESHDAAALNDFACNFIRIHRTLRTSPAMAVGCDVEALGRVGSGGTARSSRIKKAS